MFDLSSLHRTFRLTTFIFITLTSGQLSFGVEISGTSSGKNGLKPPERVAEPQIAPASNEWAKQMKKMRVPDGFTIDLFAAEPLLANPVAFTFDEHGAAYVAETYRLRTSTLDIRHYMFMLEDDLACRTTDDRIAMIKKSFPNEWQKLGIETEVVHRLTDTDGDGKADKSTVYADGMNSLLDGVASGVLARDGKVWCTNIPDLLLFNGLTKDGKAEKREVLSSGYGVRFSFTGHDLHGLILGPDGRLYFSIGDRGAHVVTKEGKTLAFPDEGAVFRCEPDGSHLEVFCHGLRNPQELAFDDHGNLFTGDNDSDQGDRERWEYLVEGGDYGWRVGWQHNPLGTERNPWMAEHLWEPRRTDTPAYVLSPIVLLPDGPSGIAHYPGTGLPAEFVDHFFVCSFKGSSARSAIAMLRVKENGAGFIVDKGPETFLGNAQATDVEFGPDSNLYFSEWGEGWESTKGGRIYKLTHPAAQAAQATQIAEVKRLLGEGFRQRSNDELAKLLAHPDQRVRFEAQWALAEKEDEKRFAHAALHGVEGPARAISRLHGIWGLGQIARRLGNTEMVKNRNVPVLSPLLPLATDPDAEVRAQVMRVLGESAWGPRDGEKAAIGALRDESPRVRFFAAQSLVRQLRDKRTIDAVLAMIRENNDRDEFLRHAGVMVLSAYINSSIDAGKAAKDESRAVRLAELLAMRRLKSHEIAVFLADEEPFLVKEAALAINDEGIADAYPVLAKLIEKPRNDEQLMLRVINANFRSGNAAALATYAADNAQPEALRIEALQALALWTNPPPRDRVTGLFRPLPARDAQPAVAALKSALPKVLTDKSAAVLVATVDALSALSMKEEGPALFSLMTNQTQAKGRGAALATLAKFDDPKLAEAIKLALTDQDPTLRVQASALLGKLNPDEAAKQLAGAFADAAIPEKKAVVTALAELKSASADKALANLLDQLIAGRVPGEVQLELLEAAAKRSAAEVKSKLAAYNANLPKNDPLAAYAATLVGGNKEAGETLFKEHAIAACLRCHKINGSGGEAGPDLTGIGTRKDRRYLLESIVAPNAQIAEGFQTIMVTLKNGDLQAGIIKFETDKELTLQMPIPNAPEVTVAKADIKLRENAPSGMLPNLGELLTKRELRDLVEYVANLTEP
ncbi:MAG TPA: PVC-type heme-binding CxxCH protein [Chthoniobacteraceae bacterium]|nr:PVC-type heme-binding CxxCH protein [Chthoniobacteraceae bacterium]